MASQENSPTKSPNKNKTPTKSPARARIYECGDCSPSKRKPVVTDMAQAQGTACFRKEVPFHMMIQGAINGSSFTVEGKGLGDSNTGRMKGKWVCTSGKLPMSWSAISATLGYGFKCFANFPNGLQHFFQEAMPEGYTQERVTRFQDDGTLKTYHEIHMQKGIVMNKVTLQGEGFKADSPILSDGIKCMLPTTERTFPFEEGVKSLNHNVFPTKDDKGYVLATQTTVNRPLGEGRNVTAPVPHFTRAQIKQYKDTDDDSDHIIQDEIVEGYHLSLFDH